MLSRIAESLYWIGRYLERADDTSRILEVQLHQLLEDPSANEEVVSSSLLSALGISSPNNTAMNFQDAINQLSFSIDQPSSILSSMISTRENARGIRESISSELWECINVSYNTLLAHSVSKKRMGPREFFQLARIIKERVALAMGIADTTMARDDGWLFLSIGRSLERIDMTVRLLGVRYATAKKSSDWTATLKSCSAHEIFLRIYGGNITGPAVVEFLLLDRLFPRSVHFSLATAENALAQLSPDIGRIGPAELARRTLGKARASIEFRDISELYVDLTSHLINLQSSCALTSAEISSRFFQRETVSPWLLESSIMHLEGM